MSAKPISKHNGQGAGALVLVHDERRRQLEHNLALARVLIECQQATIERQAGEIKRVTYKLGNLLIGENRRAIKAEAKAASAVIAGYLTARFADRQHASDKRRIGELSRVAEALRGRVDRQSVALALQAERMASLEVQLIGAGYAARFFGRIYRLFKRN